MTDAYMGTPHWKPRPPCSPWRRNSTAPTPGPRRLAARPAGRPRRRRHRSPRHRNHPTAPGRRHRESVGLLQNQRPPDALRLLPRTRHVHRLRHRRSRLQSRHWSTTQTVRHALEHPRRHRHPHPPMRTSQQPLRAHLDTADSGHRGPRIDCGAGHHAVMPHHRRMAFGYGTSVPTRGLGAVIASRNGVGRVEGRRAEAKWLAAAVGTGLLCSAAVS